MSVWGAVAALTVAIVGFGGPANAAPPAFSRAPVATATASEPVDDSVTINYSVNRALKQVRPSVMCTLETVTIPCGRATESTKKLTSYALSLSGLPDGVHVFAVRFTLTDGGTATATALFTIDTVPTLEEACTELGGILTENTADGAIWTCLDDPYGGQQPAPGLDVFDLMDNWVEHLFAYCSQTLVPSATFTDEFLGEVASMSVDCRPNGG